MQEEKKRVRLVTYNIRGGLGMDGKRSLERIAQTLVEIGADIICLQEVHQRLPWSGWEDQPKRLSHLLKMPIFFQGSWGIGGSQFGNCVLTALPVKRFTRYPLPRKLAPVLAWSEPRCLLEIMCETVSGVITVFNTHWSLDSRDRMLSSKRMASILSRIQTSCILAGDLNAVSSSPEIQTLLQTGTMTDAGAALDLPTFPSLQPHRRIDYLLHSSRLSLKSLRVLDTQASDHLPVVAEWE
jgi:endonuclease/exonuclease/phosphatase family metal-dependent hydrolase